MKTSSKVSVILLTIISSFFIGYNHSFALDLDVSENTKYVLTEKSSSKSVVKVQTLLKKVGAYDGEIDGKYDSIKETIVKLQIDFSIVTKEDNEKAGKVDNDFLLKVQTKYASTFQKEKYDDVVSDYNEKQDEEKIEEELAESVDTKFVVTAYYSPLPGQKKYSTGSYSGDIRLNGNGTHGASGVGVHDGFLAAPKNYPFGTKIYLDGIGVGIVEDRGGAIVNAGSRGHSYDRIDVWMGYGDEGLARALNWGKRTVDGKILGDDAEIIVNFKSSVASEYYDLKVSPESDSKAVKQLQELLKKIGHYSGKIDGKYSSVEKPLIEYQKKAGIITNKESWGAGYFGEQTFLAVQKDLNGELKDSSSSVALLEHKEAAITREQISEEEKELLTGSEKLELRSLSQKLEAAISKKANGNRIIITNYNNKIKAKLESAIDTSKNEKKKEQLQYLLNLLK